MATPIPEFRLAQAMRDQEAAYRDDRPDFVFDDDLRPTRHVVIRPAPDWRRIANWTIIAIALGNILYFGGQLLRGVL